MRLPKPGAFIPLTVEDFEPSGLGRARLGKKEVRVEDGLPGETGELMVLHVGHRIHGVLARDEDSPDRRAPVCPRWTPASPCRIMHLTPAAQAAFKRARVAEALSAHGVEAPVGETLVVPPELGWRSRGTWVVARSRDQIVLGAYRRGTHVVQPMADCPLTVAPVTEAALALEAVLTERSAPVAAPGLPLAGGEACGAPPDPAARIGRQAAPPERETLDPGGLRHVAIQSGDDARVAVALLTPSGQLEGAAGLAEALAERLPSLAAVYLGPSGPGDVVFGRGRLETVWQGGAPLTVTTGGLAFQIGPRTFFQVNRPAAERLQDRAVAAAGTGSIIDVYTGVGVLALRLAAAGATVTAIDSVADSIAVAQQAASRHGLLARLVQADAAVGLAGLEGPVDAITVNPPRKGCDRKVLDEVIRLAPKTLVYVSCNPDSLARDLAVLLEAGYAVGEVTPADQFPNSEHVEVLAVLGRDPRD